MPYYIYRVLPFAQLEKLAEFDAFKDASSHAKSLRAAQAIGDEGKIKLMFAGSPIRAEDQLLQIRDPGPTGDD